MVQNRIIWTIGEKSYFVYYPIISYWDIKVYRDETMYMGISHWKKGVSGTYLISISTMVLIDMRAVPLIPLFQWDIPISIVSTL